MRYLLFAALILLSISSCNPVKEPEFRDFKNLRVVDSNSDFIEIAADAILYNPNSFGINLSGAEFDVSVEEEKLGVVKQDDFANINAKEEFVYPINAKLDLANLQKGFLGKLGKALQIFADGEMDLQIEGHFTVQVMKKDIRIPITHREKVPIK